LQAEIQPSYKPSVRQDYHSMKTVRCRPYPLLLLLQELFFGLSSSACEQQQQQQQHNNNKNILLLLLIIIVVIKIIIAINNNWTAVKSHDSKITRLTNYATTWKRWSIYPLSSYNTTSWPPLHWPFFHPGASRAARLILEAVLVETAVTIYRQQLQRESHKTHCLNQYKCYTDVHLKWLQQYRPLYLQNFNSLSHYLGKSWLCWFRTERGCLGSSDRIRTQTPSPGTPDKSSRGPHLPSATTSDNVVSHQPAPACIHVQVAWW